MSEPTTAPINISATGRVKLRKKGKFRGLKVTLALLVLVMALISVMLPNLCRSREGVNRVKCASNLRQIGFAINSYASAHGGAYPDSFATLLASEDITSDVFVCPSSNDERATGATTQAVQAALGTPGHLSYVYAGQGLNANTVAADAVVAYEPFANHDNDGASVLFGDGHVEFDRKEAVETMINPPAR